MNGRGGAKSTSLMRLVGLIGLLAVAFALLACDGGGVSGPPTGVSAVAGLYGAGGTVEGETFGAIVFEADTADIHRDLLEEGAAIELELREDGTTAGRLFVPADGSATPDAGLAADTLRTPGPDDLPLDADLVGSWRLDGGVVHLDLAADVFLRDLALIAGDGRLEGEETFDGVRIRVVLERLAEGTTDPAVTGSLSFAAGVDVMESFPIQLVGFLSVTNRGRDRVTFGVGGCPVLLRVRRPGDMAVVWDQGEEVVCVAVRRLIVLEPDASITLHTPTSSATDILGETLPDGMYRIGVYLRSDEDETEVDAGPVELSIPR